MKRGMRRRTSSLRRPWPAAILVALVLAGGCSKGPAAPAGPPPPVPVTVAPVVQKTVPVEIRLFGTVEANLTAAIKSQVTGVLATVHFKEGQNVKAGDLLFSIDPPPFEASLRQAEANLACDTAQYENAEKEAARQADLLKKGVTAQGEFDTARTAADALAAQAKADQAAVENARIQLAYCRLRSPIDGRAGVWRVHQGNLVKANDVTLTVINQVRPIQVSFAVPQRELQGIQEHMAKGPLDVRVTVPGQEDHFEKGQLIFVDNAVDRTTGTIQLKAVFPNPQERLWPGLYVEVVLTVSQEPNTLIIPSRAVQVGQAGQFVYVVKADQTVEARPIVVERSLDDNAVVSKGLAGGEQVVTDGQLRLVPGAKIVVKGATAATGGSRAAAEATPPASEAPKARSEMPMP